LSSNAGFTSVIANLPATVQNAGMEVVLNTVNVQHKNFNWTSSFNLSIPRNKLVSFPGLASNPTYGFSYQVGKSLFTKPTYRYTGFEDVNHDGVLNTKDLQFLNQLTQNYFGGLQNSFSYKGWHLDILIQFVKQTAANYLSTFSIPGFNNQQQPTAVLNAWQKPGDNAIIQKYTQGVGDATTAYQNYARSDAFLSDASFLRLKNLFLSYTLPSTWQRQLHLQNTRLYIQGQNLFTITSYLGLDPETQGLALPPLRMITGGIQVGF
jgi:hypothetical protein